MLSSFSHRCHGHLYTIWIARKVTGLSASMWCHLEKTYYFVLTLPFNFEAPQSLERRLDISAVLVSLLTERTNIVLECFEVPL